MYFLHYLNLLSKSKQLKQHSVHDDNYFKTNFMSANNSKTEQTYTVKNCLRTYESHLLYKMNYYS